MPNVGHCFFSFSLSDCFNCSVVVLMDLRPWSGSCLSDFQLLFVNNLKKKKKKLYILETNLCEFFIGTNVVFNTRGFVQFFAFSTRKQCKVISQCEEKKKIATMTKRTVCSCSNKRDSINSKSWFSRRNAFSLPCLSFSFLSCFDLQKKMSFLCEIVLYYVENYGFYFNGLKKKKGKKSPYCFSDLITEFV